VIASGQAHQLNGCLWEDVGATDGEFQGKGGGAAFHTRQFGFGGAPGVRFGREVTT
jgi:hypothetical protein